MTGAPAILILTDRGGSSTAERGVLSVVEYELEHISQPAATTGLQSKMLNYSEEQSDNVIIIHSNCDGAADTNRHTDKGRFHQDYH